MSRSFLWIAGLQMAYVLSLLNSSSRIVTNIKDAYNTFNKHHKMSPNTLPLDHQGLTGHFITSIKIYAPTKISCNPGCKCINWY